MWARSEGRSRESRTRDNAVHKSAADDSRAIRIRSEIVTLAGREGAAGAASAVAGFGFGLGEASRRFSGRSSAAGVLDARSSLSPAALAPRRTGRSSSAASSDTAAASTASAAAGWLLVHPRHAGLLTNAILVLYALRLEGGGRQHGDLFALVDAADHFGVVEVAGAEHDEPRLERLTLLHEHEARATATAARLATTLDPGGGESAAPGLRTSSRAGAASRAGVARGGHGLDTPRP